MKNTVSLLKGEAAMPSAPIVEVNETLACIPQHYLVYAHTRESVESILLDIDYHDHFLVFINGANDNITLQVGVVGYDNYRSVYKQAGRKIVYGRKWRVEPQLPSSEIVQTVFLALAKAREHEVRELFKLNVSGVTTTPFSCHQDLPMMAYNGQHNAERMSFAGYHENQHIPLDAIFQWIKFDGASVRLKNQEQRACGQWLLDIEVAPSKDSRLPETQATITTLLVDELNVNTILYQLMDYFLMRSQRHLEEHFRFKGFKRFSRNNQVCNISHLSSLTRHRQSELISDAEEGDGFSQTLAYMNYQTDRSRVPQWVDSVYSHKLKAKLARLDVTEGILPFTPN